MRKVQKFVGVCASVATLAVAMAIAAPAGAAGPEDVGPVKGQFTFAWWGAQDRITKTDNILKLYQAKYPGVSVVRQNSDWGPYWDKLTIEASAGNMPCTMMMQNRWLATYASPKVLLPLDQYVKSGVLDVTGIAKSTMESARGDDGNLYYIPSSVFFNGIMYNQTWLEKAGLKAPAYNWTWDDMAKLIAEMKGHVPQGAVPAHDMAMEPDMFVSWVQSHGQKVFDKGKVAFTKQMVADWFNYWEKLRKAGLTDTPDVMVEENGSLIENSDIANGRAFMTARPPNRLDSHQKVVDTVMPGEKLAVAPAPTGPSGGGWDVGSNGIAIGANCPKESIPAALAWVNFFTQNPQAAKIYNSDLGPVAIDSLQQAQIDNPNASRGQRDMIKMFREVAPEAKPILWPPKSNGLLADALSRDYQAVAFGQESVDDGAAQVIDDLSSIGQ